MVPWLPPMLFFLSNTNLKQRKKEGSSGLIETMEWFDAASLKFSIWVSERLSITHFKEKNKENKENKVIERIFISWDGFSS